jgi:hypothetical protein
MHAHFLAKFGKKLQSIDTPRIIRLGLGNVDTAEPARKLIGRPHPYFLLVKKCVRLDAVQAAAVLDKIAPPRAGGRDTLL